jgi:hypothetical protein
MIDPEAAYRLIDLELGQRRAPGLRQAALAWNATPADAASGTAPCCVPEEGNDAA